MIPIADFNFSYAAPGGGDEILLQDTSSNLPTSWVWNFSDGSYSTEQNPAHTFIQGGSFVVSLKASNSDGYNITSQLVDIPILEVTTFIGVDKYIQNNIPQVIWDVVSLKVGFIKSLKYKWGMMLSNQKSIPVSSDRITFDGAWSPSERTLIAELVIYNLLVMDSSGSLFTGGGSGAEMGDNLKAVETGPSKVEFQSVSSFWSGSGANSMLGIKKSMVCMLSRSMGYRLFICPAKDLNVSSIVSRYPLNGLDDSILPTHNPANLLK